MYSKEFESKIKRYVGNGNISPQQRKELHEEAEKYKIDDEELDIVIDGYIYLAQHQMLDNATAYRVDSQKQKNQVLNIQQTMVSISKTLYN